MFLCYTGEVEVVGVAGEESRAKKLKSGTKNSKRRDAGRGAGDIYPMTVARRVCRRLKSDGSNGPFQSGTTENEDEDEDESLKWSVTWSVRQ